MSQQFGIKAIMPVDNPHILGHASARSGATDLILDVWNGSASSSRRFAVQKDGQVWGQSLNASTPTYSFEADADLGIYRIGGDRLGVAANGSLSLEVGDGYTLVGDDLELRFGTGSDYWFTYNASSGQLELWTTDGDGGGTDTLLAKVDDGGTLLTLTSFVGTVPNTGTLSFGSDCNLYRDDTNVLKTDDAFVAAAGLRADEIRDAAGAPSGSVTLQGSLDVTGDLTVGTFDFTNSITLEGLAASDGNAADADFRYKFSALGSSIPANRFYVTQEASANGPDPIVALEGIAFARPTAGGTKGGDHIGIRGRVEGYTGGSYGTGAKLIGIEALAYGAGAPLDLPDKAMAIRAETFLRNNIADAYGIFVVPAGGTSATLFGVSPGNPDENNYGVYVEAPGAVASTGGEVATLYLGDPTLQASVTVATILAASGAKLTPGGVWTDASSIERKANVQPLRQRSDALTAFFDLQPTRFDRKVGPGDKMEPDIGFIAEDVPELVAAGDRTGVAPGRVAALAVLGAQHANTRLDDVERRLAALEARR